MKIEQCPITKYGLRHENEIEVSDGHIEYDSLSIGKVKITKEAFSYLKDKPEANWTLAGVCYHHFLKTGQRKVISMDYITKEFLNEKIPGDFESKCYEALNALYLLIGKENRELELNIATYCAIGYSNPEEFSRIIKYLDSENYVTYRKYHRMHGFQSLYMGFEVTSYGKSKAKESLPNLPLIGLVSQTIHTGNHDLDQKINHAVSIFHHIPKDINKMRDACETLSFVLEPIRKELENQFESKDVNDFFSIVNNFDIRHNKEKTKKLEYPEQLEWVFYSLLNTLNTFYKLKRKQNAS